MNITEVTMVHVYMTEGEHRLAEILQVLHDDLKVKGVTVFRGITGFGKSGKMHSSNLLDLKMDLPLVLEFFDLPEKIEQVLDRINNKFEPGHIVTWNAKVVI